MLNTLGPHIHSVSNPTVASEVGNYGESVFPAQRNSNNSTQTAFEALLETRLMQKHEWYPGINSELVLTNHLILQLT
jgi:hypothetical protein